MTGLRSVLAVALHGLTCHLDDGESCGEIEPFDLEDAAHVEAAVTAWLAERLGGEAVREAVAGVCGVGNYCSHTGPVVNDGCEDCRTLADAALAAVVGALAGES